MIPMTIQLPFKSSSLRGQFLRMMKFIPLILISLSLMPYPLQLSPLSLDTFFLIEA